MIELLIVADDRTGALEVAGACADVGCGPVAVGIELPTVREGTAVVDLGSRHVSSAEAAAAVVRAAGTQAVRSAHKIDSTLRGNWAHEVVARHDAAGGRVLVVAAFPDVGRTCVGGVVHIHGVPLAVGDGADARRGAASNRPADLLLDAGASAVTTLRDGGEVAAWAASEGAPPFAVCDAVSNADLLAIGRAWAQVDNVLLAGTAAAIGAGAGACVVDPIASVAVPLVEPVLVVCGSLHPVARAQVRALERAGVASATVGAPLGGVLAALQAGRSASIATSAAAAVDDDGAIESARQLAAAVAEARAAVDVPTLVVLGGDTAAAVLGDEPVLVGGTVGPGMPWGRRIGGGPLIVTKAGGFGDEHTLVRLLPERME